jgi:hypothetical protein
LLVFGQNSQQLNQTNTEDISDALMLSVETDQEKYLLGQSVEIFGNLTSGSPNEPEIRIIINSSSESRTIVNMTLTVINGSYSYRGVIPATDAGFYQIFAKTSMSNKSDSAFIQLVDPLSSRVWVSIIPLTISTIIFFITIFKPSSPFEIVLRRFGHKRVSDNKGTESQTQDEESKESKFRQAEIFRFIALTGISLSLISIFIFIETEISPDGPVGLVKVNNNGEPSNKAITPWAVNIGGSRDNNYQSGLLIPSYVIVLGLGGSYMRYLHKAYSRIEDSKERQAEREEYEKTETGFMRYSIGELADILLAPVIAIAVWLIVYQEIASVFMLGALSLTVGLVTTDIIRGLQNFAKGTFPGTQKPPGEDKSSLSLKTYFTKEGAKRKAEDHLKKRHDDTLVEDPIFHTFFDDSSRQWFVIQYKKKEEGQFERLAVVVIDDSTGEASLVQS